MKYKSEASSETVGATLMIAITVALAFVIAWFVFNTGSSMEEFNQANEYFKDAREIRDINKTWAKDRVMCGIETYRGLGYVNSYNLVCSGNGVADVFIISDDVNTVSKYTYGNGGEIEIDINQWYVGYKEIYVFVCDPDGNKFRKHYSVKNPQPTPNPTSYPDAVEYCKSRGGC